MTELMRVAALSGYFQTMEAMGADPAPLLREAGLSRNLLSNPEQMISARAAIQLLERSAAVTGCRTFALRMGTCRGLGDLGAAGLLIQHEPTLQEALSALVRYRNRINPCLIVQVRHIGDAALIQVGAAVSEHDQLQQITDLAVSSVAGLCFLLLGEKWQPEMICFTCEAPPASDLPVYHSVFRCRTEFNAECNGIVIAYSDLEIPPMRADVTLAEHARRLIDASTSVQPPSLAQQVEQSMLLLLPSGRATIHSCAALLGVTVRTLQRALVAEGTSFSIILNKAKIQLANQYLSNPGTRICDVAGMLGYNSNSAFTRWHHQTYGMSPMGRRKSLLDRPPMS